MKRIYPIEVIRPILTSTHPVFTPQSKKTMTNQKKTIHLIIRDTHFIAAYLCVNGFAIIRGRYRITKRGDLEATLRGEKIYSKTMTGLKQKIRLTIKKIDYDDILN